MKESTMGKWLATLDVSESWAKFEACQLSPRNIAKEIAQKLSAINVGDRDDREAWIHDLQTFEGSEEEFDDMWDNFYDFCDDSRIWVKTFLC